MKQYLIDTFKYNDWANKKVLEAISELKEKNEAIALFAHLIRAQDKWMNRITKKYEDTSLPWFEELPDYSKLPEMWEASIHEWIQLIENAGEKDLGTPVLFKRPKDGQEMKISLMDLALQLNYHSIHHRAQINKLLSAQGVKVPATDYIFTKLELVQ